MTSNAVDYNVINDGYNDDTMLVDSFFGIGNTFHRGEKKDKDRIKTPAKITLYEIYCLELIRDSQLQIR